MAFDCFCIDLKNKTNEKNITVIQEKFPQAKILPFTKNYKNTIDYAVETAKTEYVWILTSLIDYTEFDFDFIPEQFEKDQIHVWHSTTQKEADTFLICKKKFLEQINKLKFLRDYKDINYHFCKDIKYEKWPMKSFTLNNLLSQIKQQKERYVHYYYLDKSETAVPSFWEDQKLYISDTNKLNLTVPKFKFDTELYEHTNILELNRQSKKIPVFDIVFIHNYEGDWKNNYELLKKFCKNLPNKLKLVEGVKGRNSAYKTAANISDTEYFYAVFSKCKIKSNFKFDFIPDTLKTPRHYIFDCYNPLLDYTYGHQAVILYNKAMVLENKGTGLDFTLAQQHDHIKILANETTFYSDPDVCFRTTFREIIKLHYWKKNKPTVENSFILNKWLGCNDAIVIDACTKASSYFAKHADNYDKLF
ncbi:MAG TPA: hypothetical protein DEG69_06060, partial [Flavobacteriaceae bacterium]|nr:hypothetical protein [Flavobacteriaceae bacterium]